VGAVSRGAGGGDGRRLDFTIAPYAWFSGISGDISVANLAEIPVEATFSDMIEDVDVAWVAAQWTSTTTRGGPRPTGLRDRVRRPRLWFAYLW